MRSISFTKRNRSGNILHIETDMGIVNIHVGLSNGAGDPVEVVTVLADYGCTASGGIYETGDPNTGHKAGAGIRIIGPKEES